MKTFFQFLSEKTQFDIAYQIASKAHSRQKDISGIPYMQHVNGVIRSVSHLGDEVKAVAALHDVVEDTDISISSLQQYGLSERVLQAVDAITKRRGEVYTAYLRRVKANPIALAIKIADVKHNISRLKNLKPERAEILKKKYQVALSILECFYFDTDDVLPHRTTLVERAASTLEIQPWAADMPSKVDKKSASEIYDRIMKFVLAAKNEYVRLLRRAANNKDDKILSDIKSLSSFINKTIDRGAKVGKITDVLRGAILASTQQDVDRIVKNIKKYSRVKEHRIKEFGSDKKYGYYGSHHFIVQVGEVLAEIQVMTKKLWTYKHVAHDIYTELRSGSDLSDAEVKKMLQTSKTMFRIGNSFRS